MAKKNITKIGTTAAFAVAMTAALTIQASADETIENPVEIPVETPVVEAPAVVETSTDAQEVAQHNDAVESSNNQVVQENVDTSVGNAETSSGNDSAASSNESTSSGNDSAAAGNDSTVESNDTVVTDNQNTISGNDSTASGNENTVPENDNVVSGNEIIDEANQDTANKNEDLIKDNEDLPQDLPDAPTKPEDIKDPSLPDISGELDAPENPDLSETPDAIETPDLPQVPGAPETPDLDVDNTDDYNDQVGDYNEKIDETNDQINDYNNKVDDYNGKIDETNGQINDYNDKVSDANGQIDDYNGQVNDYNDKVNDYNEKVDEANGQINNYNDKVSDYNNQVNDYNEAVDKINGALQEQHKEEEKIHAAKTEAFAAYEDAIAAMDEAYAALGEDPSEEELAAYQASIQAAKDAYAEKHAEFTEYAEGLNAYGAHLNEKLVYEQEKKAHEDKVSQDETRQEIYDQVQDYNQGIIDGNEQIKKDNAALKNGLHADIVGTLEEAAKTNATVDAKLAETAEGRAILATLSQENRDALDSETATLEKTAAALKAEGEKGYDLGSKEYADYLERVKKYNAAVEALNKKRADYNTAVAEYNKQVDEYNADKPETSNSTTGGGTQQEEGKDIDWGNVVFDTYGGILTHMDVKYNAAASRDVTEDENGDKSYSEKVTQYTVTGVYAEQGDEGYGVAYSNDDWKTSKEQALQKDKDNDEFGNTLNNHLGETLDPVNGEIRFDVTLTDSEGKTHKITVNLDAESVYSNGSYYKPEANDFLKDFCYLDEDGNVIRDENGQPVGLPTERIDGELYYNISGQPVYLISALVCDGMTNGRWVQTNPWNPWQGYTENEGTLYAHGLDLILNLQTMIDIHKADNARKITYQGYQLGMLAAAEAPGGGPGEGPQEVGDIELLKGPGEFTKDLVQLEKLNTIHELETLDNLNTIHGLETLDKLDTIENKLDTLDTLDELDYKMVLVIPEVIPGETPEEEPVWFFDDVPVEEPEVVFLAEEGNLVNILDEMVPLADAPLTGDASGLFGLASLFSLGGLLMLNKKKRT